MHPVLFHVGAWPFPTYALFVLAGLVVAGRLRRDAMARLGLDQLPGHEQVSLGALVGAVLGAKLGMLLFEPWAGVGRLLRQMLDLDFTGKTVVGALVGGFLGVELVKRRVGITRRTGDAYAVALPVGMAIGRLGCLLNGCCNGVMWAGPWAVEIGGVSRHPAQLYEAGLDLLIAAFTAFYPGRSWPEGHRFRRVLVLYATARFGLEWLRDDFYRMLGPFSGVQVVCLLTIVGFSVSMWRRETAATG